MIHTSRNMSRPGRAEGREEDKRNNYALTRFSLQATFFFLLSLFPKHEALEFYNANPPATGPSEVIRVASIRAILPRLRIIVPDTSPLSCLVRSPRLSCLCVRHVRARHCGSARKRVPRSVATDPELPFTCQLMFINGTKQRRSKVNRPMRMTRIGVCEAREHRRSESFVSSLATALTARHADQIKDVRSRAPRD